MLKNNILLFILMLGSQQIWSQTLKGRILDSSTNEAIPFTNVIWMQSGIGTLADQNGEFIINIPLEEDSLLISSVGYSDVRFSKAQAISKSTFALQSESVDIDDVEITVSKRKKRNRKIDPAYLLHKKIIANRDKNDLKRSPGYSCDVYNKIEVDLNNVDSSTKNDLLFKPIAFVFKDIDSSSLPKAFVPIFMSEAYSNYFYKSKPTREKDIIVASQNTGLKIQSLAQFTGNAYTDFNIYKEYINLLQKSFVSPLADQAWISYNFYLMDSTISGDTTYYRLDFFPRRKHDLTFKGFMYVNNKTYGVNSIHLEMAENANVNFLKWMAIDQEYGMVDSTWCLKKETTFMDVNPLNKAYGFYIRKTTNWLNYDLDLTDQNIQFNNADLITVQDSAYEKGKQILQELRPTKLSNEETHTFEKMDSAMNTRYVKIIKNLTQMMYTGYYPLKYWEYGPYYTTYSWNNLEGQRVRVGMQTTPSLFKTTQFKGHYAYGFGDKKSKFRAGIKQFYGLKKQWRYFELSYLNDYKILSASENAFQEDNILAALTRKTDPKFTHTKRLQLEWFHEWYNGINNSIKLKTEEYKPIGLLTYLTPSGDPIDKINVNSITIAGGIAYQEKFVNYGFRRLSLNTRKPKFSYAYTRGLEIDGVGYNFHSGRIEMTDRYYLGFLGYTEAVIFASKIWGDLPYPLLLNHQGNDSYYFDNKAFNMMNPFEFVSDQQVSVMLLHNFNGMFFNGVPLLKKLHLRSFIFAKGAYGSLNNSHENIVVLPEGLSALSEPYLEVGFGIENIFHIIRLDFIWRLTNTSATDIQKFGVTFDLVPSF